MEDPYEKISQQRQPIPPKPHHIKWKGIISINDK